jgi:hypothetical protein
MGKKSDGGGINMIETGMSQRALDGMVSDVLKSPETKDPRGPDVVKGRHSIEDLPYGFVKGSES